MITIRALLAQTTRQLEEAGIESARLDASLLLAHALGMTREKLLVNIDNNLNNNEIFEFYALVARRQHHEPIAYITGKKEFWSLDFCVTRDTLIPRPDSETLVEAALKRVRDRAKPITLLDIGTGTACLLIALLKELPRARGIGVDNSERALQVANDNAKRHGVSDRTQFTRSHWCDALHGTFDLIISNPPYVAEGALSALMPDVARFEPRAALDGGVDGLDAYRVLAPQMPRLLKEGAAAVFEIGQGQEKEVMRLLQDEGLTTETAEKDFAGIQRCVVARKTKTLRTH